MSRYYTVESPSVLGDCVSIQKPLPFFSSAVPVMVFAFQLHKRCLVLQVMAMTRTPSSSNDIMMMSITIVFVIGGSVVVVASEIVFLVLHGACESFDASSICCCAFDADVAAFRLFCLCVSCSCCFVALVIDAVDRCLAVLLLMNSPRYPGAMSHLPRARRLIPRPWWRTAP